MIRINFKEIVIDNIRYFVLPDNLPLEDLEQLDFITIRQYGFNVPIYLITEEIIQEILNDKQQ